MPELPEVEVVRRGLAPHLTGRTITGVQVLHPRPVRRHLAGPSDFEATLVGRRFGEPRRRGKYLWLPLTDGDAILAHLGMSGQFRMASPQAELARNTRVRFALDSGMELHFVDQRMFGGLSLTLDGAELPGEVSHIGLDLFDQSVDVPAVARRIRARKTGIKRALLDQTLTSGIGNIYADEALWASRLHYARATDTMPLPRIRDLLHNAKHVMAEALKQGGTSFDSLYVNVNGESGYFSRELAVYGREDLPCERCGNSIVREPFMNRSSYRCPRCQRRPKDLRG